MNFNCFVVAHILDISCKIFVVIGVSAAHFFSIFCNGISGRLRTVVSKFFCMPDCDNFSTGAFDSVCCYEAD